MSNSFNVRRKRLNGQNITRSALAKIWISGFNIKTIMGKAFFRQKKIFFYCNLWYRKKFGLNIKCKSLGTIQHDISESNMNLYYLHYRQRTSTFGLVQCNNWLTVGQI